jgi:TRAP-type mannitol/chloroaromatic compound transport system permease small subunit
MTATRHDKRRQRAGEATEGGRTRMPETIVRFVHAVDAMNRRIGRIAMYMIFAMMAVLLYSSISKTFFNPSLVTLELAQFLMVSYFLLGGPYSMQMGDHVRMDLVYGAWSDRTKTWVDAFTVIFLLIYLGVLLYGGINSTYYSILYNDRAPTAWRPYMWPIKSIMTFGIFLMLLQALAAFFRDVAKLRGREI